MPALAPLDDTALVALTVGNNSANHSEKSEYELTREANIAKNQQLFHELRQKFGWDNEESDESKKKNGNMKKDKGATQERIGSSARTSLR